MFGPRGTSIEAASSAGTGARMCAWTTAGRADGRSASSGAGSSRGSAISPFSSEAAATAGEHRYTWSSAVPLRPRVRAAARRAGRLDLRVTAVVADASGNRAPAVRRTVRLRSR